MKVDKKTDNNNIREYLLKYGKHWKWFALSVLMVVVLAYFYIRYTIPEYASNASVMILEDKSSSSENAIFQDLGVFASNSRKVQDEIEVLTSRSAFIETARRLNLNIQYFNKGRIIEPQIYPNIPISVNFFSTDSIIYKSRLSANLKIISNNRFSFNENSGLEEETVPKNYSFGEKFTTSLGEVIITPSPDYISNYIGKTIKMEIKPLDQVAQGLKTKVMAIPTEDNSNVVDIAINSENRQQGNDILNTLIEVYKQNIVDEKTLVSKNTTDFLNDRINLIAADLADVDNVAERFKTGNRLTNIAADADIYLESGSANEQRMVETGTELSMVNFMKESLDTQKSFESIPANMGLSDEGITEITSKYNNLVLERQRLLKSSNEKNPVVVNLDQQLEGLRQSMSQSLDNLSNTLKIKYNDLQDRASRINSRIYSVPGQERELRDIQRQQQIKESLYLYLLEKREESEIATASVSPNLKIIDKAYVVSNTPVTPKKKFVYLAAIIIGMFIPFSILYAQDLFNNKIYNKEDLQKLFPDIPVLGELPKIDDKKEKAIKINDRSILAESFRLIRTNLDHVMKKQKNKRNNNVVFITSTINGEGKSFVAYNLALTLAYSNKKTLIIGGDIRNPGLNLFLNGIPTNVGLTEYLQKAEIEVEEIINPIYNDIPLDIILSGKIPPNPAELLMSDRLGYLFDAVTDIYDYIIVDTAPSMLVTDTLLISKYAGHTIYLTRAEYTDKRMLDYPRELFDDHKLNGMVMVVNDVDTSNFSYGGRYGYGYYGTNRKAKKVKKKRFEKVKI
ncbi:GumC family protein [Zhouia amylolytica]|nr:tyrosine-protein kinase [Zhouia amylolytica]